MNYMFQNFAGFQRRSQLIVTPKKGDILTTLEIRTDNNPEDYKKYQLTDQELVDLRNLLDSFIGKESDRLTKSQLDIQDVEVIEWLGYQ